MNELLPIQSSITPEKAKKILRDHGMNVTNEQAEIILKFFSSLVQSTQHANSRSLHKSKHRRTG